MLELLLYTVIVLYLLGIGLSVLWVMILNWKFKSHKSDFIPMDKDNLDV